jgi:hypothetical protein
MKRKDAKDAQDTKDMEEMPDSKIPIGRCLDDFKFIVCIEVYKVDDDGKRIKGVAYLKDRDIAEAYAQQFVDASYYKTRDVVVITNGKLSFLVGEAIYIAENENVRLTIREQALKKLTSAERKVLNL